MERQQRGKRLSPPKMGCCQDSIEAGGLGITDIQQEYFSLFVAV